MPILRVKQHSRAPADLLLNCQPPEGRLFQRSQPPDDGLPQLTLGAAPDGGAHVHLPGSSLPDQAALVQRSAVNAVPVLILSSCDRSVAIRIQGRPIAGIRALRHGDRVQIGPSEILYLEAAPYKLVKGSAWIGKECSICKDSLDAGDQMILDPRSDQSCHDFCWKKLDIHPVNRFPIRRFLLAGLRGQVKLDHVKREEEWECAVKSCQEGRLRPNSEVIVCPKCRAHFHPGCFLAREECPECKFNIAELLNRTVFFR